MNLPYIIHEKLYLTCPVMKSKITNIWSVFRFLHYPFLLFHFSVIQWAEWNRQSDWQKLDASSEGKSLKPLQPSTTGTVMLRQLNLWPDLDFVLCFLMHLFKTLFLIGATNSNNLTAFSLGITLLLVVHLFTCHISDFLLKIL